MMKMVRINHLLVLAMMLIYQSDIYPQVVNNTLQMVSLTEAVESYYANPRSNKGLKTSDIQSETPVNGYLYVLSDPLCYHGFWVSRFCHRKSFKEGNLIEDKRLHSFSRGYADEPFGEVQVDGQWWDRLQQERILLTHDINRLYKSLRGKLPLLPKVTDYTLLIEQAESGSYSIHLLEPQTLSPSELKVIKRLQKTIGKLDKDCLFTLYTKDGLKFPYRYVRATYLLSGRWIIFDDLK